MESARSGLVDMVREFLEVHEEMSKLFLRFRAHQLDFESVRRLCGDSDESPLFRLKERCHALFRDGHGQEGAMRREALFDLAVGSLFHEAMKFRENFYQQEVYAPKVEALRGGAGAESDELFREFEKILAGAANRIEEALQESEALLAHTADQLRVLLVDRCDGLITRFLIEHRERFESFLPDGLDALLSEIHGGDALEGYVAAAGSYLESAHFRHALGALDEAQRRATGREDLSRLARYARGMRDFTAGDYRASLCALEEWIDAGPGPNESRSLSLAHSAISRIDHLVKPDDDPDLVTRARALARRMEPLLEGAGVAVA